MKMPSRSERHFFAVVLLLVGLPLAAQQSEATTDPWAPFRLLEGTWEGAIDGILGQGVGDRRYEWVMDDRYLIQHHASVRQPQEKSPRGDHHREIAIYSFDSERERIVERVFNVEGFVIRSACDVDGMRIVCTSESVENGTGMKSRKTMEIESPYRFVETFELASPGQELSIYLRNTWTRVPAVE